ncbi:MAG TPA: TfoX/Sxy family protein [Candidatus Limnocylindrales bacterium]|nr:TfoX/Sxy family protein [Candidatus Limnocylindrales bacterium]
MPEKPRFEKPAPELVAQFEAAVGRIARPDVTRRPMFGHPCAWIGGNMATGLFAQQWWVRLPPERLAMVLASGEATPFEVMPGRAMKDYGVMSPTVVGNPPMLDAWLRDAFDFTATLPPKK